MARRRQGAGRLRHSVDLCRPDTVAGEVDDLGQPITGRVVVVAGLRANIQPSRGVEQFAAAAPLAGVTHLVEVRRSPQTDAIGPDWWFEHDGRRLEVVTCWRLDELPWYLLVDCREVF